MFCTKNDFEDALIKMINTNIIDMDEDKIKNIYSAWKEEFTSGIPNPDFKIFIQDKASISDKQHVPSGAYLHGIDFPIWFGTNTRTNTDSPALFNKKKIMIVGIDPLRSEKYFHGDMYKDVVIGTPYALHLKKMRDGKTKQYWKFIEDLSKNHFIYLTDIYKVFFKTGKGLMDRSHVYYGNNSDFLTRQKELLKKEIELIEPDLIITFGNDSYLQLLGEYPKKKITTIKLLDLIESKIEYNDRTVLPMVHLAGGARKWQNFFLQNNLQDFSTNYGQEYAKIVEDFISKQNDGNL